MKKLTVLALAFSTLLTACFRAEQTAGPRPARSVEAAMTAAPTASPTPSAAPRQSDAFTRALGLYEDEKLDEAETAFREIVAKEPKNAQAHFYLGKINADRRDFEAAAPFFEQAAKLDGKSTEKIIALGDNQRALKQFDRAVVQYQKAIGFAPENPTSYYGLGLTYLGLKNKIAAGQQLRKLETLDKALADKLKAEIEKK